MMRTVLWILGVAVAAIGSPGRADDGPFSAITFDEALTLAARQNKLVFVDFYTSWCAPCKIMDKTVFTDERVIQWLQGNTIPIKYDADKHRALADRFKVNSYPTFLFIKPDGTEVDRLGGNLDAASFLEDLIRSNSSDDPYAKAKRRLAAAGQNNPSARMDYAETLVRLGRRDEALTEYLWCFDDGPVRDAGFYPLRNSMLVLRIADLGRSYPPALEALRVRRDRVRQGLLLAGSNSPEDVRQLAEAFAGLNDALSERADTLKVFDELLRGNAGAPALRELGRFVLDDLLAARRYADVLATRSLETAVAELDAQFQVRPENLPEDIQREFDKYEAAARRDLLTRYYEVFLGLGKSQDAAAVAQHAVSVDPAAETYRMLADRALRSGQPLPENVEQARKAVALSGGQEAEAIETLARLLHNAGKTGEACEMLSDHIRSAAPGRDRDVLQTCATVLKCPP